MAPLPTYPKACAYLLLNSSDLALVFLLDSFLLISSGREVGSEWEWSSSQKQDSGRTLKHRLSAPLFLLKLSQILKQLLK